MMKYLIAAILSLLFTTATSHESVRGLPKLNINIGNDRPENCVEGNGPEVYVGEVYYGGIKRVNLLTGEVKTVVPSFGFLERTSSGIIPVNGYLFVAGGGTLETKPELFVYSIKTGKQVVACSPPYNFTQAVINDVAVLGGKAYFTDSHNNALIVVDIAAAKRGRCVLSTIPLPEDPFFDPTYQSFLANGIVAFRGGLVISNLSRGGIYFVNLKTNNVTEIAPGTAAPTVDGMRLAGNLLYAVENFNNRIAVWRLRGGRGVVSAVRLGYINSTLFDTPTGVAIYKKWAFACNFRVDFESGPFAPGEEFGNNSLTFNLIGVNRFSYK